MKNNKNNKKKIFIEILNDFLINTIRFINKNFKILCLFVYLCFNVFMIFNYNGLSKLTWIIISIGLLLVIILSYKVDDELKRRNKSNKIPILDKRITQKIDDQIYIEREEWEKAVLYLSDLEDYFENVGLIKKYY